MVFGGAVLVCTSLMGSFGDDDGYHLLAPKRWLASGTLDYLATYAHTNAPMGFEMLYAIALSLGNPTAAKMLHELPVPMIVVPRTRATTEGGSR
jgi:hypothetical protein